MFNPSFSFCLLALTAAIGPVLADQGVLADVTSAANSPLSSLSSLFHATPSINVVPAVSICCGDSCCAQCCDDFRTIPTNLAYAYPPPTPAPYTQSFDTRRPCCTLGCVDGACRIPTATLSQRPQITDEPRRRGGQTINTLNIVVGCCETCTDCDQAVTSIPANEFVAEATPTASIAAPKEKVPLAPGQAAVCIGCGKCHPCDDAIIQTYVEFLAHPTDQPDDIAAQAATITTTATASTVTTSNAAEPTYYLGDEINDAINGQNQDIIPIVIQSGDPKTSTLLTLLATIDFKLTENYISRRLLKHLSLLQDVKPFPKGVASRIAYLSYHQDKTVIDAYIDLDFVAGNGNEGTQRHFANVGFQVYGKETDSQLRIPDVIIGTKFLREVGGLTVFPRFKTEVQKGVRVVYPAHDGVLQGSNNREAVAGVAGGEEKGKHDEL